MAGGTDTETIGVSRWVENAGRGRRADDAVIGQARRAAVSGRGSALVGLQRGWTRGRRWRISDARQRGQGRCTEARSVAELLSGRSGASLNDAVDARWLSSITNAVALVRAKAGFADDNVMGVAGVALDLQVGGWRVWTGGATHATERCNRTIRTQGRAPHLGVREGEGLSGSLLKGRLHAPEGKSLGRLGSRVGRAPGSFLGDSSKHLPTKYTAGETQRRIAAS